MALLLAGFGQRAATADHMTVTAVQGSAVGCYASVSHFGGPPAVRGPTATAEIPTTGGSDSETVPECRVVIGPAIIFTSGPITVTSGGTTGPAGAVTSTATVGPVNTSQQEVFTASGLSSTCTANESGVTGSTTVTNGVLLTSEGDTDVEGDETYVNIPTNPDPNTTYEGQIEAVGDSFRAVFNEQIVNPDGSLTVNAYHLYLLGPTAVGDLIVGTVTCGVTTMVAPTTTSTTLPPTTTTTLPPTTTTTLPPTTTSTTLPPTTTTTLPPTTTSTTLPPTTTSTTLPPTTTTTLPPTTTTTMLFPPTSTTTTPGACVPGRDGARPGYGKGDKNHVHCGPPGQTGAGGRQGAMNSRPITSTRPLPVWLIAGAGILFLSSLFIPFRRMTGEHSTKR